MLFAENKQVLDNMDLNLFKESHYKGLLEFIAKDLHDLDIKLNGDEVLFTYYDKSDINEKHIVDNIHVVIIINDRFHEYNYSTKNESPLITYVSKPKITGVNTFFIEFDEDFETGNLTPKDFVSLVINFENDAINIYEHEVYSNKKFNELYKEFVNRIQ